MAFPYNLWFKILLIKKINLGICFFSCSLRRSHHLFLLGPVNQLLTGLSLVARRKHSVWRSSLLFTIFMTSSWELIWSENILRKLSQAKEFSWINEEGKKLGKKKTFWWNGEIPVAVPEMDTHRGHWCRSTCSNFSLLVLQISELAEKVFKVSLGDTDI